MQLTQHFSLEDFTRSDVAERAGIDNTLPMGLLDDAVETAQMMERIRAKLSDLAGHQTPIFPSSGYRCPELNWVVRYPLRGAGMDDSGDHPLMAAVDFRAPSFGTPLQICRAIAPFVSELGIGQLIYELSWVHVSKRQQANSANRIITKVAGGYAPGIVA